MSDLRAMITAQEPTEAKPTIAAEPVKAEPVTEAAQDPAEPKQQPTEDEPLPEGVQKRIAKEAEKAARIQSEIDRAVSTRKAKEKELADLTATGSQPAPTSAAAKKAPEFGETGHESETYAQFQTRDREHLRAEVAAEAESKFEAKFAAREQQAKAQVKWDAAIATHGKEFPALMAKAQEVAPEGLQHAISALDDWSGVAVHLAKDPAKLKELAAEYEANPVRAIAKLGRIEASLKSAAKPATEPVLPNPPAKDGGGSSASVGAFDIEASKMSQIRRHATKLGLFKAG